MPYTEKQTRFLGAVAGGHAKKKTSLTPSKAKEMLRHGKSRAGKPEGLITKARKAAHGLKRSR